MNIFRLHQLRQPEEAANLLRPENIHIPFLLQGAYSKESIVSSESTVIVLTWSIAESYAV